MLRAALLDFQALLGNVQVQGPAAAESFAGDLADPLRGTGAHAVRCRADRDLLGERLEVLQVLVGGAFDEPLLPRVFGHPEPASRVRDAQQHHPQARFLRRARDGEVQLVRIGIGLSRRIAVQVMEFAHRGDPSPRHFQETESGDGVEILRRQPLRRCVHRLAPAPEVVPRMVPVLRPPADGALESMAVGSHESGKQSAPRHGNDFGTLGRIPHGFHEPVAHDQRCARVDMAAGKEEIGLQGAHGRRDVASSAEKSHIGATTRPSRIV